MGWTSDGDPPETISRLQFADRQSAVQFCPSTRLPYVAQALNAICEQDEASRTKIDGHHGGDPFKKYNSPELGRQDNRLERPASDMEER